MKNLIIKFVIIIGFIGTLIFLLSFVPAVMPFYDEAYTLQVTNNTSENIIFVTLINKDSNYSQLSFLKTPLWLSVFSSLNIDTSVTRYYDYYGDNIYVFAKGNNDFYLQGPISYKDNEIVLTNSDISNTNSIDLAIYNIVFPVIFYLAISILFFASAKMAKTKLVKYWFFVFTFLGCVYFIGHSIAAIRLFSWF